MPSDPVSKQADDMKYSNEELLKAFRRFVPQKILELIGRKSVADISVGDETELNLTALFADIRDFTSISEQMTPRQNFQFINEYLGAMEPIIQSGHGIIDKYIGDAILAIFPGSADDAVLAAIAMLKSLRESNKSRTESGAPPFDIGIGLNTGLMMLGAIGGATRIDTTIISDSVNLASRLDSLTKVYHTPLLISEYTRYALKDSEKYNIRFLDRLAVKGKKKPVSVYEVYNSDPADLVTQKTNNKTLYQEGVALYHLTDIAEAKIRLEKCVQDCPHDLPARIYLDRCIEYEKTGTHYGTGEVDLKIEWDESLTVGEDSLDEEHRDLFRLAQVFIDSVRSGQPKARIDQNLEKLEECVVNHFKNEEEHMSQHDYPFLYIQEHQHARFLEYFSDLKLRFAEDTASTHMYLLFMLQTLIVDWLVNHTAREDKHYGRHINNNRLTTV